MRIVFWTSDKEREHVVAETMRRAVEPWGDELVERCTATYQRPDHEADVACAIGVKGKTRQIMLDSGRVGQKFLMFDKAHLYPKNGRRGWETWRVSLGDLFPIDYMMEFADREDRFSALGWDVAPPVPWTEDKAVAFVGSSDKHMAWHGEESAQQFAEKMCKLLRKRLGREVIYRPKPSWVNGMPPETDLRIEKTTFSPPDEPFGKVLERCCLVVVAGSNASVEALVSGVAVACTGDNVALPLLGLADLAFLHRLRAPPRERLMPWLNAVAWCQWGSTELDRMWGCMRERILAPLGPRPTDHRRRVIDRMSPVRK